MRNTYGHGVVLRAGEDCGVLDAPNRDIDASRASLNRQRQFEPKDRPELGRKWCKMEQKGRTLYAVCVTHMIRISPAVPVSARWICPAATQNTAISARFPPNLCSLRCESGAIVPSSAESPRATFSSAVPLVTVAQNSVGSSEPSPSASAAASRLVESVACTPTARPVRVGFEGRGCGGE